MSEIYTLPKAAKMIGVTPNTIYLWEKKNKVPYAKRDRRGVRICTLEWIELCIAFRDRVVDPNEELTNENTAG